MPDFLSLPRMDELAESSICGVQQERSLKDYRL
jgi:hypothetical protein